MQKITKAIAATTLAVGLAFASMAPASADQYPSDGVNCPNSTDWHAGFDTYTRGHMSYAVQNGAGDTKIWHTFYSDGTGGYKEIFKDAPAVHGWYVYGTGWPTKGYSTEYADSLEFEGLCVLNG